MSLTPGRAVSVTCIGFPTARDLRGAGVGNGRDGVRNRQSAREDWVYPNLNRLGCGGHLADLLGDHTADGDGGGGGR